MSFLFQLLAWRVVRPAVFLHGIHPRFRLIFRHVLAPAVFLQMADASDALHLNIVLAFVLDALATDSASENCEAVVFDKEHRHSSLFPVAFVCC